VSKIIHLINRTDLFKISNLVLGGEAIVTNLYSSLEKQSERERRPVRLEEIMLVTSREQRYVTEPIETKYLKFGLLNLFGSSGI
jgi:hypothetical protein